MGEEQIATRGMLLCFLIELLPNSFLQCSPVLFLTIHRFIVQLNTPVSSALLFESMKVSFSAKILILSLDIHASS